MWGWERTSPPTTRPSNLRSLPGGGPSKERPSSTILLRPSRDVGRGRSGSPCWWGKGRSPVPCGNSLLPRRSWLGRRPSCRGGRCIGLWGGSGGVFSRAGLTVEVLLLSFFGAVELGGSSVLALTVFSGFEAVEDDESFFLVTAASPVFFFTLSLLALTTSVFTLAFSF